jgi:hypothetical protein
LAQWWLQAAWTPADAPHLDLTCGTGPRWLIAYPPPLLRTPALWRARSAWTWATWVALALLSPVLTAAVLIWMIGSDLMGRLVPEWLASGFAWVPDTVPALAATLAASAVTIVLTAGLLGYLTVFSNRDIDPDAPLAPLRRGRSSSGGGSAPKPAVKDAAPYA